MKPSRRLCVLDFDGDLSDRLAEDGVTTPLLSWACFHTSMRVMAGDGLPCGIVPRTVGGPYVVWPSNCGRPARRDSLPPSQPAEVSR